MKLGLRGIGVVGPGLADAAQALTALRAPAAWSAAPTVIPAPALLPPAERRRAGAVVKLSLAVAQEACAQAGVEPAALATVFSSSSGDGANCHALCEALATPDRAVSPTRFTNSVHNAAAGYWHIATVNRQPSTSLCAHDASFAAGLLEAAMQVQATGRPVLLVVGDVPYPQPLLATRPITDSFGVAWVLDRVEAQDAVATLDLATTDRAGDDTRCASAGFEAVRLGIPAARCLPLLERLALGAAGSVVLGRAEGLPLRIEVASR
ncbi:MAG TPA: beta-ketoacyl synthase chain length factor [Methylibium sp.]|uniref:beta-ketoacyl synthase chain length factor n=1 Tax=Methylibium sp. TaxID=2067992 RepID=UPI002DBF2D91|nr:beta-ketoacyl synthase chain length factor [Methylibium sp.]HEU4458410.1 beta-ketoacyl synthase chain length factor [Methylibium sp.]